MEGMTEEQLRSMPFVGNMKPWTLIGKEEDLPAGNDNKGMDW
jgi:hypothetical protein